MTCRAATAPWTGSMSMPDTSTTTALSRELLAANAELLSQLPAHPWIRALASGELPEAALITWAQQCRLFCFQESKALLALRALGPSPDLGQLLVQLVDDDTDRIPSELEEMLVSLQAPIVEKPTLECLGYGSYVRCCAAEGLLAGTTAIWAIYKSYYDAWSAVRHTAAAGSLGRKWVENWSGPQWEAFVAALGRCVDELGGDPPEEIRGRLESVVGAVAEFELGFWDMSLRGEGPTSLQAAQP
jgi:thiaminase/transcriptional activator TenA